jgi:formylmethanofuran dehydrogenase subunit E
VHYCDRCGGEIPDDEIYEVDGEELCEDCLKEKFRKEK